MDSTRPATYPKVVGRYVVCEEIAAGGMATVHLGRLLGPVGFSRTIAIKKLHPQLAKDPEFTAMFLDEARLAARIRHPNVVPTLDVVAQSGELVLVMEYVHGESLGQLQRVLRARGETIPPRIAGSIVAGALQGLHAAHEATNERGEPLGLVHRDVSPQNVLVGVDGIARIFDFGVAKAIGRLHTTRHGQVKGKLAYMAPEQIRGAPVTRQTDVFAASVVLWGALVGHRLFAADNDGELIFQVLERRIQPPGRLVAGLPPGLDEVVMRGLHRDPAKRYLTARDMAVDLERVVGVVSLNEVGEWIRSVAHERLQGREQLVSLVETVASTISPDGSATDAPSTEGTEALEEPSSVRSVPQHVSDPPSEDTASTHAVVTRPRRLPSAVRAVVLGLTVGGLAGVVAWRLAQPTTIEHEVAASAIPPPEDQANPIASAAGHAPSEASSPLHGAPAAALAAPAPTGSPGRPSVATTAPSASATARATKFPVARAKPAPRGVEHIRD